MVNFSTAPCNSRGPVAALLPASRGLPRTRSRHSLASGLPGGDFITQPEARTRSLSFVAGMGRKHFRGEEIVHSRGEIERSQAHNV
jgi:hypothetical protein